MNKEAMQTSHFPTYTLTLHRTYYNQGFFNVPVDYDQHIRPDEGSITLVLDRGQQIQGTVNRNANPNGIARVMGRAALRDWFQANFAAGNRVDVIFRAPDILHLQRNRSRADET